MALEGRRASEAVLIAGKALLQVVRHASIGASWTGHKAVLMGEEIGGVALGAGAGASAGQAVLLALHARGVGGFQVCKLWADVHTVVGV